jgi:hypothetical protein
VSRKMLDTAFTAGESTRHGKEMDYGFGWFLTNYRGTREISHSGDTIGFRTQILRLPEKKFTVIILCNRADAHPGEMAHKIADMYLFDAK